MVLRRSVKIYCDKRKDTSIFLSYTKFQIACPKGEWWVTFCYEVLLSKREGCLHVALVYKTVGKIRLPLHFRQDSIQTLLCFQTGKEKTIT